MGWNSWNWFSGKVTDRDIRQAADLIVSSGMRDAGYVYVNIDDTWEGKRDEAGVLHANEKFPDMKALADYVHSKGLKLGIYSSPAPDLWPLRRQLQPRAAGRRPLCVLGHRLLKVRSLQFSGHYDQGCTRRLDRAEPKNAGSFRKDAPSYSEHRPPHGIQLEPVRMGHDLAMGARSGCKPVAHHWRHSTQLRSHSLHRPLTGRPSQIRRTGHWNDPDMLEIGNGKLTLDQDRVHMGHWACSATKEGARLPIQGSPVTGNHVFASGRSCILEVSR